jgi:hypothetical protein
MTTAIAILVGFLISFATGWSVAACDALFRAQDRPGIFRGTSGMIILLILAGIGGFTIAGLIIWFFQALISAGVLVILAGGIVLGAAASKRLHVNAAGAANRMLVGLVVLVLLYALVWTVLRPTGPGPRPEPPDVTAPTSK